MAKRKRCDLGDSEQGQGQGAEESREHSSDSYPDVSDEPEDKDDDSDEEEGDDFVEVDADFQFFDPAENDFHGLRALLHTYLDGLQFNSSELVDAIIQQSTVGTVVKTGEDDDPIAVMTALNIQRYHDLQCFKEIHAFILGKLSDSAAQDQFKKWWSSSTSALLINERLLNCPPKLGPPLLMALVDEVQWATEDEPTQELRDSFKFDGYILFTKVYLDPLVTSAGPSSRPSSRQPPTAKARKGGDAGSERAAPPPSSLVYVRPEDEFLHAVATWSATFPVEGRAVGRDELRPARLIMGVTADKVPQARAALDAVVGNVAAQG